MARIDRQSKVTARNRDELPAFLSEAAFLLDTLHRDGITSEVGERCLIRREGGYCGLDIVLFLLVYFASSPSGGMRPFYDKARPFWRHLGALAGRRALPAPPSVSRALATADGPALGSFCRWLLVESLDLSELLMDSTAQSRDAVGRSWQIFHFDPTCTALRQRALPTREGLPDALRRAEALGKPGTPGRKRGEVMFTRSVLQHGGSGVLLDMNVEVGHGDPRGQLQSAVGAVVHLCQMTKHPIDRAVICADGQWGGLPSITTFHEGNVHFVTRCSHRSLLDNNEVRLAMATGDWVLVPDSGSGPERGAVDVGRVLLEPASGTRRDDGSAYAAQRVRLIITRYPERDGTRKKAKRGELIDHVCYELFITDLDEEAWPVEAVVALYFGRCAQENRFAQEDRELELDRIYSYDASGQELAATVGAFVWNWRILAGFRTNRPSLTDIPIQRESHPKPDGRELPDLPFEPLPTPEPAPSEAEALADDSPHIPDDPAALAAAKASSRRIIQAHLPDLLRGTVLGTRGWTVRHLTADLVCPNGEMFGWACLTTSADGTNPKAIFRTLNVGVCATCHLAAACRRDPQSKTDFRPRISLPPALADRMDFPQDQRPPRGPILTPVFRLPPSTARGHLEITPGRLLPAQMRRAARLAVSCIIFEVRLPEHRAKRPSHPFVAPDARRQRHGRCSHAENLGRYALADDAVVRVKTQATRAELARAASARRSRPHP